MTASYESLKARFIAKLFVDSTGGAAHYVTTTWLAMGRKVMAGGMFVSGTGITGFSIWAATDSAGTGAVVVATNNGATVPDTAGDQVWVEAFAEQFPAALAHSGFFNVKITSTSSDTVAVVVFVQPFDEKSGNTADVLAD